MNAGRLRMMYSIDPRNGTQAVPYDFENGTPSTSINGVRLLRRGRSPDRPAALWVERVG